MELHGSTYGCPGVRCKYRNMQTLTYIHISYTCIHTFTGYKLNQYIQNLSKFCILHNITYTRKPCVSRCLKRHLFFHVFPTFTYCAGEARCFRFLLAKMCIFPWCRQKKMQRQFCLAGARFCNHPKKVYLHVCPQAQDVFKVCLLRFFFV